MSSPTTTSTPYKGPYYTYHVSYSRWDLAKTLPSIALETIKHLAIGIFGSLAALATLGFFSPVNRRTYLHLSLAIYYTMGINWIISRMIYESRFRDHCLSATLEMQGQIVKRNEKALNLKESYLP